MIPLWHLSLLGTNGVEEFSFFGNCEFFIRGRLLTGEWVIDIRVIALPYFAWGCNNYKTGMTGAFKAVVKYYIMDVLNRLSAYTSADRKELLSVLKDGLD